MARIDVEELPYEEYSNRQLAIIPLAALAVALLVLLGAWLVTGAPVSLGIDFTGGTELQFETTDSQSNIESTFANIDIDSLRTTGTGDTWLLETQSTDNQQLRDTAESAGYELERLETQSASFGGDTQGQALIGVGLAFLGMTVLVGLIFRTLVPSVAVVVSAFSDMVIPLALMTVLGIDLSLGTVAALLMIIGYSVDSDILLNNHILRRHGSFYESSFRAMRTGVSMTLTSIAAMVTMFVVSSPWVLGIPLLPDVALVLVFGLTADLINTYLLNMSLLRWYKYEGVAQ